MADEIEKVETTEDDAANPEESEELDANESEDESEESEVATDDEDEDSGTLDHDALLQKERERLGKKVDKERAKRIEAEKNKGLTREEVEQIVAERTSQSEKRFMRERAEAIAERLASSPAEKERIMLHYENSIVPTGNLQEDIENAWAIVNKKSASGKLSELRAASQSKKTLNKGGSDAGLPAEQKPKQKFSAEIIEGAKFAGVTPEEFAKKQKA